MVRKNIFVASNTHEYVAKETFRGTFCSRAAHAARGLKRVEYHIRLDDRRRAAHAARGLKLRYGVVDRLAGMSRRACGAWIETTMTPEQADLYDVAPRMRRVD